MKIIYNNIIPFEGFIAINICGILFVRKEYKEKLTNKVINHERIHTCQIQELLYIFFYIIYLFEYIYNLFKYKFNYKQAYRNISFEKEAYVNEKNLEYINNRKLFNMWRK